MIHLENWGRHSQGVLWVNLYLGQQVVDWWSITLIAGIAMPMVSSSKWESFLNGVDSDLRVKLTEL